MMEHIDRDEDNEDSDIYKWINSTQEGHCDICGKRTKNTKLKNHFYFYNCKHCGKNFEAIRYLGIHFKNIRKSHKEIYKCEQCTERFNHEETKVIHRKN